MKKLLKFSVSVGIALCLFVGTVFTASCDTPSVSAYAYALYCVNTGEFLISSNGDVRMPMASTTKIMTAILGIEAINAADEEPVVTITADMYAEGSSMYLAAGERVLMSELVGGMLMVSGNDAANAIAKTVGGSTEGFAEIMNSKAEELGLKDTHFVTPSGLDAEGHYTTACELAKIMAYCMENSTFREIDSGSSVTVNFIEPEGKTQVYYNENKLLSRYEYCVAGKTGYTDRAGRTLVSCAEKDGIRLIAVTLNDGDDWNDHEKMYEYGFDRLSIEKVDMNFDNLSLPVVGGTKENLKLLVGQQPSVCTDEGQSAEISVTYEMPEFVYAPIAQGKTLGKIRYYANGVFVGQSEVTAAETVAYKQEPTTFTDNVISFFRKLFM